MSSLLVDKIRQKYGNSFAEAIDKVTHDPEFTSSLIDVTDSRLDTDQALATINQILAGKAPLSSAADALITVTTALGQLAKVPPVSAKAVIADRPREDGLPEALGQAVQLKQRHPLVLGAMNLDSGVWVQRRDRIFMLRGWLDWAQDFNRAVLNALSSEESTAERELRESFGTVRSVVLKNIADKEHSLISDYLYGSAEQGAQRAKENAAQREELTDKVRAQVTREVRRDARAEVTRDLAAMVGELQNPPAADPAAEAPTPPAGRGRNR